jgi:glycosyltransferase involved in cell wall biosynthesis
MGLSSIVQFHGWVPHERVNDHMGRAHFILLPSSASEGWPKVLSEAMAHGVVPIASRVSAIPQVLAEVGSGVTLPAGDVAGFVRAIRDIVDHPARWRQMVEAGLNAAHRFTYERYLVRLDEMFEAFYGSSPFDAQRLQRFREQVRAAQARVVDVC